MAFRRIRTLRKLSGNPGVRAAYRRALDAMLRDMHEDVSKAMLEEYDGAEWRMARDSAWRSPSERLADRLERLMAKWRRRFNSFAVTTAGKYLKQIWTAVRVGRKNELVELGLPQRINPSRFTSELFQALLAENVGLIRNIPDQYFSRIAQDVQRSIAAGGDRQMLVQDLRKNYGFTETRARFIARDQTAKATQALAESTDRDLGFTEGVWVHVPGRKSSRPTHIVMDGKTFTLGVGLYDKNANGKGKGAMVSPGSLPNCMCTYRPVIPKDWKA